MSIEKPLVSTIARYDVSSKEERWQKLSDWIVDRNRFRMNLGMTTIDVCKNGLCRVFDFSMHGKIALRVLMSSVEEHDDPVEAEKERLVKEYFVELERQTREQYEEQKAAGAAFFVEKTLSSGHEDFASFVASRNGQKAGHNFFSTYWSVHYPKLLERVGIVKPKPEEAFAASGQKSGLPPPAKRRKASKEVLNQSKAPQFAVGRAVPAATMWGGSKRSSSHVVVVTRTSWAAMRAKRRRGLYVSRRVGAS